MGMERSVGHAQAGDMVLHLAANDAGWLEQGFDSPTLRVWNKLDICPAVAEDGVDFEVSVKTGAGIGELLAAIGDFATESVGSREPVLLVRERQRRAVQSAIGHVEAAISAASEIEIVAEELKLAARDLSRLTGQIEAEDLLDVIFAEFCIGK
jgi:tRNA modification GTPase